MWPNPEFPAYLVTFTEEILDEKVYFLCGAACIKIKASFPFIELIILLQREMNR